MPGVQKRKPQERVRKIEPRKGHQNQGPSITLFEFQHPEFKANRFESKGFLWPQLTPTIIEMMEDQEAWGKIAGNYNQLPPNMERITEEDFWRQFLTYTGERELRQPTIERISGKGVSWGFLGSFTLFWYYDGTALMLEHQVEHNHYRPQFWKAALCVHENETDSHTRTGFHEFHCRKCGFASSRDSSG